MENKLRRGLALLMTLIMLISCAPMDALAAIVPVSGGTQTSSGVSLKSIVKPPVATTTYVFMNGTEEFARQILKNGQTLNNPGTPTADSANKEFVGWFDESGNQLTFPITASVGSASSTITVNARFADVYFVFFTNENGEVMVTKKGANGDTISTEGVTYPVGNEQSIIGWNYTGNENDPLISEVKLEGKDVKLKAVVKDGHWITFDSQGGTYVAHAFVKGGATTTAPADPTCPGYTFDHWSQTIGGAAFAFGQQLGQELTLYAVWTANTNTRYTVIHWLENANDNEYSYAKSETKTGTTGAQTSAAAKSYTGFTAQNIRQQTIAGNGSTIVDVYYKRDVYTISFYRQESHTHTYKRKEGDWWNGYTYYGGCYPENGGTSVICGKQEGTSWNVVHTIKAKWDANVTNQWPKNINGTTDWRTSKNGDTYQVSIDRMPSANKSFYDPYTSANETQETETAYYYVESLPGGAYDTTYNEKNYYLHHSDTSGGSGFNVSSDDQYEITGFTFAGGTAIGNDYDGAKFYYTRNSYNIIYINNGVQDKVVSKLYEESIADAGSYTPTVKPAGMEDYVFGGWYADPSGKQEYVFTGETMPAQNVTVYAKWNKPVYNGTIYLTIEGTTGSSITLNVPKGDTIETALNDKQAEIMRQAGEGYTWRGWRTGKDGTGEPFNPQTRITTDVTLYPYYTKDGTFTVEYVSGKNDVTAPVDTKAYAEDSFADLMSPGKLVADDGEYFLGWSDGAATYQPRDKYQIKSNHANERNVITLTAQWGARPAGTTLTYKANGGAGEDVVENLANNETVTTKPAGTFSRVGYTFKGWDTNPKGEGSIAPNTQVQVDNNGANVLYAIWTANTDTKYTVEFYYEDANGNYTLNHKDETRTATTDTRVEVTDDDKAAKENGKYVFDESNANNVLSGVVAGNGSLVLKLYFKLNTASYTIHHYLNGTTVKVADDETGTKTIGETLTANKSDALYPAYAAAEVAGYDPYQTITINATGNVITVYYTVPLTIKAKDASKTYDEKPLTQPDFTMEGLVNGDTKENFSLSMTAASTITNAGNTPNVIDESTVKYKNGDIPSIPSYYNVSYKPGTLTVKKASATVTITGVKETAVYDGKEHEANGYNYSFTGKQNEITISLKPNVLAIARRTDVGTTYMGLTKDSFTVTSANYDVTIKAVIDGYVTITPIETEIVITANSASKKYDGTPLTDDGFIFTEGVLVKGDVLTAVVEGSATNVGDEGKNVVKSYKVMRGDVDVTGNYTFGNSIDGKLTINKRTVTLTSETASKEYDGTPLTKPDVAVTGDGFVDGEVSDITATGSVTFVHEGEVPNAITYTTGANYKESNYTISKNEGKLSITKRGGEGKTITVTAANGEKVYDGAPLTNNDFTHAGALVEGDVLTAVVEGSQTDVGVGDNEVKSYRVMRGNKDVTGNYTFGESVKGTLTVNKRPVTIIAQDNKKEYDGQSHGKNPDTAYVVKAAAENSGLVSGHTESNVNIAFMAVDAGTYTDKLVIDKDAVTIVDSNNKNVTGNYAIEVEPGTLTIEQHKGEVIVTIKGNTQQFTYDCTKHTVQGFTATVNNSLYNVNTDFKYDGNLYEAATLLAVAEGTNVGVYHMNLLSNHCVNLNKNFANVTFEVQDGSLGIEKQSLVIEVANSSKVYGNADPAFADATLRFYNKTGVIIEPSADMKQELSGIDLTVHRADAGDDTIGTHVDVLDISKTAKELNDIYTNYEIGVNKGDFEITATEESLKVRANNYEDAYDGDGHGVVAKAYINGTVEAPNAVIRYYNEVTGKFDLTESPKFTDVKSATPGERTYTVRFQATLDGLTAEGSANVLIAPRKLVLSSGSGSKDYDGLPLTSQEVVIEDGHIINGQIYALKGTGSVTKVAEGKVTNTITYSTTDEYKPINYDIELVPGTLQIEKRDVILTSETASKEYDGTPLTRENVTVERNGFVDGEVTDLRATGSVTYVDQGEVTNTITFTPTDKFDENNYSITKQEGKLSITKREGEGKTITVTAANDEKVYDGTPLTNNDFTHTGVLVDGDVLTAVVEGSATNVGDEGRNVVKSYVVKRGETDVTKNYTFGNSIDGKLTINKRTVNLTSETASKEYDGKPLTKPVVTVTGNGFVTGEVSDIKATGSATFVDDGKVTNAITYTEGENFKETNYTISKEEGKLSITKRGGEGKTITVTANSDEKVYDGAPLTNNGFTHAGALVEGDELTAVVEGSQTDVGSSNNVVKSYRVMRGETDVTNNYTFGESIIGTLTVTPVAIELTAASASKAYDGTPLTNSDYTISKGAFVGEEGLAAVTIAGSQTLVGTSANTITGHTLKDNTLAQNYTITYQPGELKVTQNEKAITITANSHTWEYDGQPHSDGGYTVEYDGQTYKVEAGKTVTLPTGDIVKAKITKTVTNVSDSAPNNNTIDELTIVNAAGEDTKGQYKTIPLIPGTLTITKRGAGEEKVKITAADNTVEYDGQPHGAKLNAANQIEVGTSFTVTNLADGHSVKTLAIDGSETDAGVYADKLVPGNAVIVDGNGVEVTANYDITYVSGTLTITQRGSGDMKVVLTAANNTVVYDGQPHGVKLNDKGEIEAGVSYTITNLADGHKVQTVAIDGTETAVGEYEDRLVPSGAKIVDAAGNDVTRNYVVGYEKGKLTITSPDTVIVTISGNKDRVEYDGQKHEVNGYVVKSISNALYTDADFGFAEGAAAHAEGTDAGEYPMNLTKDSFVNKNTNFSAVTFVVTDGGLTITKRGAGEEKVKITAADNTVYYDGQPHGAKLNAAGQIEVNVSYTTEYLAPGHKVQSVVIDGSRTKVGLYKDELVPKSAVIVDKTDKDVTENYEITYVPGTLEIRKNETEIKVTANSHTWEYDGQAHSDGGYTVTYGNESYTVKAGESATLSTGDKVTAVVKGQVKDVDDTKAGNNEIVEWSVEHRDFYNNVTPANGTLTITPRKVTLTSASDSKPYDGTPLTKPEVAVTGDGFVAGEVSDIEATGSVTYVSQGEVDNLITFKKNEGFKDSNYGIEEKIGKLSIEALDVTIIITGPSAKKKYMPGVTHTIVTGGSELDFVYGSDKVEGKIGVKGMVEGDKILPGTLKHTLEGMYVGEYEGVFTLFDSNGKKADKPTVMHDGVDVTENYKFSYNPGKLTITGKHMDGDKEVENEVPEKKYLLGQKIPFTITVRSVSKDELKDVTVTDPTATILPDRNTANPAYTVSEDGHTATITSIAPEAEVIVYAEHEVTEDDIINRYTNEATINWGDDVVEVSKTPSIEEKNPEAELVKEIVLQDGQDENHKFKLGETVYFKITVTNTGNVTLNEYEVKEVLPGAAFIDGTGYTLNNDKTVATIEKMEPVKDGQEAPDSNQIVLYAQYTIKEEDLGNKELKNIVTADNSKPGEVPIPVDEAKSVSGQKIWKDEGNAFNTRPASITLTLMRKLGQNGAAEQYRTMQLGSNGSWRYSFDHLPKHDAQENEYFYWVVEEPVTGYDTAYETKDESHCDIVNNLQTYTLTIHYWQHKLGDTKMEQAFPDYVATLYYKQPYDVESPEREGIILDDMSQARISGTMPVHDLVIDVYYHRIAYRLTIHYIYRDGTMAHEDYTWTYWFNSTYNVPSPIIPGFTPSIDVIAGRMPSHGLELTVVYVGDGEIVIPDEDTSLGFKSYLNAGECFE